MRPSALPARSSRVAAPRFPGTDALARVPTVVPLSRAVRRGEAMTAMTPLALQAMLQRTEQALHSSRWFDPDSGLLQPELFFDRLSQATAGVQRGGASFAVLVIELDGGPETRAQVGQRLVALGRQSDSFTRLDGSVHAGLLLGNHSIGGSMAMAQKIVDAVAPLVRRHPEAPAVAPARAGIAMCPQHGTDPQTLLLNAHAAMLQSRCAPGAAVAASPAASR